MHVFMNKEGNKFNILDSAGVSLIWPNLDSQQNEFLNMFITVWPKAGNGFSICILSRVYLPWSLPSSPGPSQLYPTYDSQNDPFKLLLNHVNSPPKPFYGFLQPFG